MMKWGKRGRIIAYILIVLSLCQLAFAVSPSINYTDITPFTGTTVGDTHFEINFSIDHAPDDLHNVSFVWNGTNHSLYDDSLILMYNFENRSFLGEEYNAVENYTVVDLSRGGNNGTATWNSTFGAGTGPNMTTGKHGNALLFDGQGDYLEVSNEPNFDFEKTDDFSMCAWVKPKNNPGYSFIFAKLSDEGFLWYRGYSAKMTINKSTMSLDFFLGNSYWSADGLFIRSDIFNPVIEPDSRWYHTCFVYDGTSKASGMRIYMDGKSLPVSITLDNAATTALFDYPLTIGGKEDDRGFNGSIDSVRIYNRNLTANEVEELYYSELDHFALDNWKLYIDQGMKYDKDYEFYAIACDISDNCNTTLSRTITAAVPGPAINYTSPTPLNDTIYTNNTAIINFTIDEIPYDMRNLTLSYNGTNTVLYDDSLVLYMNFNNRSNLGEAGTIIQDYSKYNNDGYICTYGGQCAKFDAEGRWGSAMDFNKTWDVVQIPYNDSLSMGSGDFTLSAWVETKSITNNNIIYDHRDSAADGLFMSILISWPRCVLNGASVFHYNPFRITSMNGLSGWHNIVCVRNGTNMYIYFDGDQGTDVADVSGQTMSVTGNVTIGGQGFSRPDAGWNGSIDEVMLFNRSMSPAEIRQLYYSGLDKVNGTSWTLQVDEKLIHNGNQSFYATACDEYGNCNTTETKSIEAKLGPWLNISPPTPLNGSTITTTAALINISVDTVNHKLRSLNYSWNGSNTILYDDSLLLMMNFENRNELGECTVRNQDGCIVDLSGYGYNGTLGDSVSGTDPTWTSSGRYGGGFNFDGKDDKIVLPQDIITPGRFGNRSYAISLWAKADDAAETAYLFQMKQSEIDAWNLFTDVSGIIRFDGKWNNLWANGSTAVNLYDGKWHHIVGLWEDDDVTFRVYVDGVLKRNGYHNRNTSVTGFNYTLGWGTSGSTPYPFNGTIDSLRIYNRSLSAAEVELLYNLEMDKTNSTHWELYLNQTNITEEQTPYFATACDFYGNCDTKDRYIAMSPPPAISIIYPTATNYNVNVNVINYTAIIGALAVSDQCWYSVDGGATNSSTVSNLANFTSVTSAEGWNTWTVYCNDSLNLLGSSSVTFYQDSVYPWVNFTAPTAANASTVSDSYTIINVTIDELNLKNITWNWNGSDTVLYDDSLLLMMNFENRSELSECTIRNQAGCVRDLSKYGNNGTLGNSTSGTDPTLISSGRYGNAFYFDGSDHYINISNEANFDFERTSAFSGCAWINISDWNFERRILSKIQTSGNFAGWDFVAISGTNLKRIGISIISSFGGNNYISMYMNTSDFSGKWHHACFTYDGSSTKEGIKLYMDANEEEEIYRAGVLTESILNNNNLYVGVSGGTVYFFNGSIDSVRIYNRSLSATEIKQLYYSELDKHNSSHWELYVNETNLTTSTYTYSTTACDTFNHCNSTERYVTYSSGCSTDYGCEAGEHCLNTACTDLTANKKLVIQDSNSVNQAFFDSAGNLVLNNSYSSDNGGSCAAPEPKSFVVEDGSGNIRAWINSTGFMCVGGTVSVNQATLECKDSFVVQDNDGNYVACINKDTGDLNLSGYVSQNGNPEY